MPLRRVRVRLMLIYTLTSLALLALVSGVIFVLTVRYFQFATERALLERMALEFETLQAPLPPSLQPYRPQRPDTDKATDVGTLASTFVFAFDQEGRAFDPNPWQPPIEPDRAAFERARAGAQDWRTEQTAGGGRVRLLTQRLSRADGPAVLQVGRALNEQDAALRQLLLGLSGLGAAATVLLGWVGWWLAGRAVRPAEQAWERQQSFIANASHELRAPLTLLRASTEVALRSLPAADPNHELLGDVLEETDHMARLVEDLLLLSRLDAARLRFERSPVAAAALLGDVARHMNRVAEPRGVAVRVAGAEGEVLADPARLRQVLLILLDNALRHTPAGGSILLLAESQDKRARWSISDTGGGIAPEHLPHIFERFYRADSSRGDGQTGSGLGLAIARALIVGQGGEISVESRPGRGTTVILDLPAA